MPSVISYVRLFAVGIVGVKIAETGNKLWEPMMDADLLLVPFFFIGWLSVQIFAWYWEYSVRTYMQQGFIS